MGIIYSCFQEPAIWNPENKAFPEPAWVTLVTLTLPCLRHSHDCGLPAHCDGTWFFVIKHWYGHITHSLPKFWENPTKHRIDLSHSPHEKAEFPHEKTEAG